MKLLYTLIILLLSCSTEPEDSTPIIDDCESQIFDYEGVCDGTTVSDNNYEIDISFRYPSNVGSYWEYNCVDGINFSTTLESTTLVESMAFLEIINNNSVPDSCGNNAISFFKTDSIIYLSANDSFRQEPFFMPDSVSSDTLFYTHSSEQFSFCSSAQLKAMNKIHTNTNPPTLQYPLMVGSAWSIEDSLFTIDYEVLGEETILIDLKDGTNVNMNCFILSMNLGSGTFYFHYG